MNCKNKNKYIHLNNKGFAITSIIYSMLFLFIILMTIILLTLARRKVLIDKSKEYTKSLLNDYNETYNYDYTGDVQEFVAPRDGYYKIELWGASGSDSSTDNSGGLGAYTSGYINLSAGETLYVYVGQNSGKMESSAAYNGGGAGVSGFDGNTTQYGYAGGGATDVRLVNGNWDNFESLKSRIMVAAGGGASGLVTVANEDYIAKGGAAGGLIGYTGSDASEEHGTQYCASGGSQTEAGYIYNYNNSGTFGKGATNTYYSFGNGGGGGYYGGGASTRGHGGAGGGSSYISGHEGCNSISQNSTSDAISHTNSSVHYSKYEFEDTKMIDGNGYNWTVSKQEYEGMPTYDGNNTMVGNSGNGHAKITYVGQYLNNYKSNHYGYTGDVQRFVAPRDGYYRIELWGAQGGNISGTGYDMNGNNRGDLTYIGGKGAYTTGDVYLSESQVVYIYVGGKGSDNISLTRTENQDVGGYNGGGSLSSGQGVYGSTGGGATDIRIVSGTWNDFNSLKSRIMVAAGGGGANFRNQGYGEGNGGAGGTLIGINGEEALTEGSYFRSDYSHGYELGTGGTQNSGGYRIVYYLDGTVESVQNCTNCLGKFGMAGQVINQTGGGSGYYGGGNNAHGGAGGGSSFISGYDGCDAISENSTESNIVHTGQSIHYSGIKFENSNMIAGNSNVPTYDGTGTMTGNDGDGHAKITYIGNDSKQPEVNLSIYGFNELYLPTITDNNISISGIKINYKLDLPNSGYTFDWKQSNPDATVSFCNSNKSCEKLLPVCDDKYCVVRHGSYTTTESGYLLINLSGVSFSINNIVYRGQKVKINFNDSVLNAPNFDVKSGCIYNQGAFSCSNTHNSGDTASGDVYVFSSTGPFTKQFSIDGGEWKTDGGSSSGYYAKISEIGSHTIKVRTKYSNGGSGIYSKESEEFIIIIN